MLIRRAEISVEKRLSQTRSSSSIADAACESSGYVDIEIEKALLAIAAVTQGDPSGTIKCAKGCCHCCFRIPEVSIPELSAIWRYVDENFSESLKLEVNSAAKRFVASTQAFRPERLAQVRDHCPLLVGGLCSVYAVRPLSCRALNSTDVAACEKIKLNQLDPAARPKWAEPPSFASAAESGLRVGLIFEQLDPITVDLGVALAMLFEEPGLLQSYVDGQNRFASAIAEIEYAPAPVSRIAAHFRPAYKIEGSGRFPSGDLPMEQAAAVREASEAYLRNQDFKLFLDKDKGSEAMNAMARIDVPRVANSEEEIDQSRQDFLAAIGHFRAASFKPMEAFNALSYHQTMNLPYQGRHDRDILAAHGNFLMNDIVSKSLPHLTSPIETPRKPGKIRVGYISGHLNASNNGRWAWTWVRQHSKDFETYCFLVGSETDAITDRFRQHSDHFYWLNRSVPENAEFIRSQDIDFLIYTDVGMFARTLQYACLRLARKQATAWGSPVTSGLPTIDLYISSQYMESHDADSHYTEKLVRLPRSGMLFYRESVQVPQRTRDYFGLPLAGPFILMGQACMKLTPRHDHIFRRIHDRLGTPVVFLESAPSGDSERVKERFRKAEIPARWIPPVTHLDYLALLGLADVSIDPFMWSGGNTTIQALAAGTPVVTFPGPFMRSRHSFAFLKQAGVPNLIASSEDQYLDLICEPDRLSEAMRPLAVQELYGDVGIIEALEKIILETLQMV
jgi:Fe-S-cluster containining protein